MGRKRINPLNRQRNYAVLVLSVGFNLGLLVLLAMDARVKFGPDSAAPGPEAMQVALIRFWSPKPAAAPLSGSQAARASSTPRPTAPTGSSVAAPSQTPPSAPPSALSAATDSSAGDANLRGLLQALGRCGPDNPVARTPAERSRCNAQLAAAARHMPPIDTIPTDKRRYYDVVAAAYANLRHSPAPVSVTVGMAHARNPTPEPPRPNRSEGGERWMAPTGAHLPGVTCVPMLAKALGQTADKPTNGVGAGGCYVIPPSGVLTEEADIPPPQDARPK